MKGRERAKGKFIRSEDAFSKDRKNAAEKVKNFGSERQRIDK